MNPDTILALPSDKVTPATTDAFIDAQHQLKRMLRDPETADAKHYRLPLQRWTLSQYIIRDLEPPFWAYLDKWPKKVRTVNQIRTD